MFSMELIYLENEILNKIRKLFMMLGMINVENFANLFLRAFNFKKALIPIQ